MNAKHTPGPWEHIGKGDIMGKEDNGYGLGYVHVCSVFHRTVRSRTNANARLIAAAPELLEALQWLVDLMPDPELDIDTVQREQVIKAKAAIAKATNPD